MMKTKIFLIGILTFIFSCQDDDSQSFPEKTVSNIEWSLGEYINFSYNDDRTVKSIDINNDIILHFEYENSKIDRLTIQWGPDGNSDVHDFTYDEGGKINSFSREGMVYDVIYDSAEDSYAYEENEGGLIKIFMEGNDVFRLVDDTGMQPESYTYYYYENENHGPLAASNPVNLHILLTLPDPLIVFIATNFSQKPLVEYDEGGRLFQFENTYDEEGFIILRSYFSFNDEPVNDIFNYINH